MIETLSSKSRDTIVTNSYNVLVLWEGKLLTSALYALCYSVTLHPQLNFRGKYSNLFKDSTRLFYSLGRYFVYIFALIIVGNAVFIAVEQNNAEVFFLALFNVEIVLKLYTYGFKEFFSRAWNT